MVDFVVLMFELDCIAKEVCITDIKIADFSIWRAYYSPKHSSTFCMHGCSGIAPPLQGRKYGIHNVCSKSRIYDL